MIQNLWMKHMTNEFLHIVYKTTNLVNGKIYVGVHKTLDLDNDCYYGSGKYYLASQNKYGKINFSREVLYIYHSEKVSYARERYIVNKDFISREDTYNIKLGGIGGFHGCYTKEAIEKRINTLIKLYGSINGAMMTVSSRRKSSNTRRSNNRYDVSHLQGPLVRTKANNTIKSKYGSYGGQFKSEEVILKANISRINKSLDKYPELHTNCILFSPSCEEITRGSMHEVSKFMYGQSLAVKKKYILVNSIKLDRKIRGKWKGYKIEKLNK